MIEVRLHGLGGHGVVSCAHLVGRAALKSGNWAHSFPFFTTAMRGGMVTAFVRIDDSAINQHCFISQPNLVILFDLRLMANTDVIEGISAQTRLLANSTQPSFADGKASGELYCVAAERIARDTIKRPILSTVMAGAAIRLLDEIPLVFLEEAIKESLSERLHEKNIKAAQLGFESVKLVEGVNT